MYDNYPVYGCLNERLSFEEKYGYPGCMGINNFIECTFSILLCFFSPISDSDFQKQ